jgi:cytosine/adenosine deaminase-related metal-dependent hydrolase
VVATLAHELDVPLHVHLSEQPAENRAALAETGLTPTALLDREGLLGPRTSVVHATHLTEEDIAAIGAAGATVVMCATTEADLGDGLGAAADLVAAGARLAVGTDAHVTVDLLEEARRIEQHDRLRTHRRGHHSPATLVEAVIGGGAASLGLPRPAIVVGAPADLVTLATSSPRFAGSDGSLAALLRAGTADDVTGLIVAGNPVVVDGRHVAVTDVADKLSAAIASATGVTGSGPPPGIREPSVP